MSPAPESAAARWRAALAEWTIPQEILAAAPEPPWQLRPQQFASRADRALREGPTTPSRIRALEALPDGGAVLDVGAGAGAASLPLLSRASLLVAVDGDAAMLDELRARVPAKIELAVVQGRWPDVAGEVGVVDVVVCNHVAYNMPDLDAAVAAMTARARRRVVLELTALHPRSRQNFLWPIFHGIDRPTRPTADDALAVVRETGADAHVEERTPADPMLASHDLQHLAAEVRRYLCLGPERDDDLAAALEPHLVRSGELVGLPPLPMVTIWWDVAR